MTVSRREILLAVPASALLAKVASGQTPNVQPGAQPIAPTQDPLFAPCLLIGGRKQIENCSFALTKLQSDDAKAFAKAEIEEHQTMKKNLKALGFDYPVAPAPGARPGRPAQWAVTSGPTPLSTDAAMMVALDHEVAEQCIANYRAELGKLEGREFDKRFVGNQLDVHMELLDKVQTFRKHASAKAEPVLAAGQKVIETHIATLKKMMATLDKGDKGNEK